MQEKEEADFLVFWLSPVVEKCVNENVLRGRR
jgi:hypothetical protein